MESVCLCVSVSATGQVADYYRLCCVIFFLLDSVTSYFISLSLSLLSFSFTQSMTVYHLSSHFVDLFITCHLLLLLLLVFLPSPCVASRPSSAPSPFCRSPDISFFSRSSMSRLLALKGLPWRRPPPRYSSLTSISMRRSTTLPWTFPERRRSWKD